MASKSADFSKFSYLQGAGITAKHLETILFTDVDGTFAHRISRRLPPYPTFGILVDLLEYAVDLSLANSCTVSSILGKWIQSLFPACAVSRFDRIERRVRNIALPVYSGKCPSGYLDRVWRPKIQQCQPQDDQSKDNYITQLQLPLLLYYYCIETNILLLQ